jgi:hypothetical protein
VTVAVLVVLSMVATSVAFAGVAAAEPTVSVDHDAVVEPGEQTTITVSGSDTGELRVRGDVAGWIVNESDPANLLTSPNPGNIPYVSEAGDVWGAVFSSVGTHTYELAVTAPEETGTYEFTAQSGDNTTQNFTITVADPSVSVSHDDRVATGDRTMVTVNGSDVSELRVDGVASGWTVVESSADGDGEATLTPSDLPATSEDGDTWRASFANVSAESSYTLALEAPEQEGAYDFTAVGGNGAVTENFTIEVASIVDAPSVVAPGEQTTITVSDDPTGELKVSGDVGGWVVNETDPGSLTTIPNPADTPYVSDGNDTWGNVFTSVGDNTFELTVTAPQQAGNYTFTAISKHNETELRQNVTVEVTTQTEHESGVDREKYDAVAGDDGLSRSEILTAIQNYLSGQPIQNVELDRDDILGLIQYYLTAG